MVEFRNVALGYDGRTVFRNLTFTVEYWEKIAILGGSGAGKTSILMLMLGLIRPNEGAILVDGSEIGRLPEAKLQSTRTNFTIVFQEGALFDSLTVKENIAFCLREGRGLSEREIDERVRELLRKVGMEEDIDLMPDELSGGMQRRVAIARALAAGTPRMMLYDEPTVGLDPITADTICGLMNELADGKSPDRAGLIIVTHNLRDAAKVADRFLYLRKQIMFDGTFPALVQVNEPEIKKFVAESTHTPNELGPVRE